MTKINWKFIAFWVVLFWCWYCWPTEAEPLVSIHVEPRLIAPMPGKPTTFHIRWKILRHKENRHWVLAYGCDSGESSFSGQEMEGDFAPLTYDIYRDVKAGTGCNFRVCVFRQKETPFACADQAVLAPEEPP